jgi:hypothetical protein
MTVWKTTVQFLKKLQLVALPSAQKDLDTFFEMHERFKRAIGSKKQFYNVPLDDENPLDGDLDSYRQTELEALWPEECRNDDRDLWIEWRDQDNNMKFNIPTSPHYKSICLGFSSDPEGVRKFLENMQLRQDMEMKESLTLV